MTPTEARALASEAEYFYDGMTLEIGDPAGRLIAALRTLADDVERLTGENERLRKQVPKSGEPFHIQTTEPTP